MVAFIDFEAVTFLIEPCPIACHKIIDLPQVPLATLARFVSRKARSSYLRLIGSLFGVTSGTWGKVYRITPLRHNNVNYYNIFKLIIRFNGLSNKKTPFDKLALFKGNIQLYLVAAINKLWKTPIHSLFLLWLHNEAVIEFNRSYL